MSKLDRPNNQDADFSPERRRFLRTGLDVVTGVAAFALASSLQGRFLYALESLRGRNWRDGLQLLRKAAREERNEQLGIFTGSKDSGEWIGSTEGTAARVHLSNAQLAHTVISDGNREHIKTGVSFDHTHPESTILQDGFRANNVPTLSDERHRELKRFFGLPSGGDIGFAATGTAEKYLTMAGMEHGPIEYGVVTADERWAIRKIEWNDDNRKMYPEAYARHQQREEMYPRVHNMITAWLEKIPDVTQQLFNTELNDEKWNDVAKNGTQRADVIAHLMITQEIQLLKPEWKALWQRPDAPGLMIVELSRYWGIRAMRRIDLHKSHLGSEIMRGNKSFEQAIREWQKTIRDELGLELSLEVYAQ